MPQDGYGCLTYTNTDLIATETRYSDLTGTNKIGSTTMTYDPASRLTNLQHFNGSMTIIANYTYTYDLASRLTTEVLNSTTTTYQYDTANELTSDTANNYSYDLNGNRTSGGTQTGGNNEITTDGTWTYTFDQEGNLVKKSKGTNAETWTFGYDNLNHLIWSKDAATDGGAATTLATYLYDVFGNRIEKDVWTSQSGTTTVSRFAWADNQIWADLNNSNALVTRYLLGDKIDQLIARIAASGTAAWYLTDRVGSVRDLVDNSGGLIDHLNYDGFGNVTFEAQPANGDRFKWTSRELDAETGLQYNRARYYDPKTGRWISQDSAGFAAGDPNLYRYVDNSTPNGTDPSGLFGPGPGFNPGAAYAAYQQAQQEQQKYYDQVRFYLTKTEEGRMALQRLRVTPRTTAKYVGYIEARYQHSTTGEFGPGRVWGLTNHQIPTFGPVGARPSTQVYIALNLDRSVPASDAAATIIHEMTHARLFGYGRRQNEFAPMLAEAKYYAEMLNKGFITIEQVPIPYQNFVSRSRREWKWYPDPLAVKAYEEYLKARKQSWFQYTDYQFGRWPPVLIIP